MFPLTLPEILTKDFTDNISLSYFQDLLVGGDILQEPSILLYGNHPSRIKEFNYYLQFGGLPALYNNSLNNKEKQDWLKNYVKTYLERDVRDIADIRDLEPFSKLLRLLAINTGQLANYSRLAAEAGVSPKTAQRFIEYMNISYQIVSLQSWSRNYKKRLVKSPKIHFLDPGVMRAISQKKDPLNGSEFESAIISEIYKQAKMVNADLNFYHLRTSDGREVDLLIESEKGYIAIEIKQTKHVRSVDGRHLRDIDAILDKPVIHKFILSNDYHVKDFNNKTTAISAVQFLT
jgi:predicted AAA+ superfamily ATPase